MTEDDKPFLTEHDQRFLRWVLLVAVVIAGVSLIGKAYYDKRQRQKRSDAMVKEFEEDLQQFETRMEYRDRMNDETVLDEIETNTQWDD